MMIIFLLSPRRFLFLHSKTNLNEILFSPRAYFFPLIHRSIVRIGYPMGRKKKRTTFFFANLCLTVLSFDRFFSYKKKYVRICQIQGIQSLPAIVFFSLRSFTRCRWIRLMYPIETARFFFSSLYLAS